jgi:hypothetical protein
MQQGTANILNGFIVSVEMHIDLTSALVGGEWSASRPCWLQPVKGHPILIGWGPRGGLDAVEERNVLTLPGLEL